MKVKVTDLRKYIFVIGFVLAIFDCGLRFERIEELSYFRIMSVGLFVSLVPFLRRLKSILVYYIGAIIYSVFMIVWFDGDNSIFISHSIHWLLIVVLWGMIIVLGDENYTFNFWRFIDWITVMTLVLYFIEVFFSVHLFSGVQKVAGHNVFYWNVNELSTALIIPAIYYLLTFFYSHKLDSLVKVAGIMLVYLNEDCKANILSLALAFGLIVLCKNASILRKYRKIILLCSSILLVFILLVVISINPNIASSDLQTILINPIKRIIALDISRNAGSINVRYSAIVVGIKTLIRTKGFGVGIGNSIPILKSYNFYELQSMHNIIMQLWVELGFYFLIPFILFAIRIVKDFWKNDDNLIYVFRFVVLICSPIIAAQSSTGILSNYTFWICLFCLYSWKEKVC